MAIRIQSYPTTDEVLEARYFGLAEPGLATVLELEAETLRGADLTGMRLSRALLADAAPKRDLSGAVFTRAHLESPSLSLATLREAVFTKAVVEYGKFSSSDLTGARFDRAKISDCDFDEADLTRVDFSGAGLSHATLTGAKLEGAVFTGAKLGGADFRGARIDRTVFTGCKGLGEARGLDALVYDGPVAIDEATVLANVAGLPDSFLAALGWHPDAILEARLRYGPLPKLSSCFISYARADAAFVARLREGLLRIGARCWQDVTDLRGGERWREKIESQIKRCEKFLVVCSRHSLSSAEVIRELELCHLRERSTGTSVLVPVSIDGWIVSPRSLALGEEKVASGAWTQNWVSHVRGYHVLDFRGWPDPAAFADPLRKLGLALGRKRSRTPRARPRRAKRT